MDSSTQKTCRCFHVGWRAAPAVEQHRDLVWDTNFLSARCLFVVERLDDVKLVVSAAAKHMSSSVQADTFCFAVAGRLRAATWRR
jgi:hypothetical protein